MTLLSGKDAVLSTPESGNAKGQLAHIAFTATHKCVEFEVNVNYVISVSQ